MLHPLVFGKRREVFIDGYSFYLFLRSLGTMDAVSRRREAACAWCEYVDENY